MLKSSKEIFEILSKGAFISVNSTDELNRKYYDLIEDDLDAYREYYEGVGFILESGNGYFYFPRTEQKVSMGEKLSRFCVWIDRLDFLKTFNSSFESGYVFTKSKILERISCDLELKEKAPKLYSDKKSHEEIVDKLIDDLSKMGFIEVENEVDGSFRVTAAFHYLEEMVNCLNVVEGADALPE